MKTYTKVDAETYFNGPVKLLPIVEHDDDGNPFTTLYWQEMRFHSKPTVSKAVPADMNEIIECCNKFLDDDSANELPL